MRDFLFLKEVCLPPPHLFRQRDEPVVVDDEHLQTGQLAQGRRKVAQLIAAEKKNRENKMWETEYVHEKIGQLVSSSL